MWLKDFKSFVLKGNMVDLSIGVTIGTVFGSVVNSLVKDIMMPPLGFFLGKVDFSNLAFKLHVPGSTNLPVEVKIGNFINTVLNFLIVATAIFIIIKLMNRLRGVDPESSHKFKDCPECCMSIPHEAQKCGHCCSVIKQEKVNRRKERE